MTAPTAPPARRPQAVKHTTATMTLARTMYGNGDGWTPTEIARYLEVQGTPAHVSTIKRWVIPGYAEQHREHVNRRYHDKAKGLAARSRGETDRERLVRVGLELRSRGMTYGAIAIALGVCEGIRCTGETVRSVLRAAGAPPDHRRGRTFRAASQ